MPVQGKREVMVCLYSFFNFGARWGWVVNATLWSLQPGKDTRYLSYRGLVGYQERPGRMRKYLATTGIRTPDRPSHSDTRVTLE